MKELYTERLYLRKIKFEDADQIFTCWSSDDDVTKYLTWPAHKNVDVTKKILNQWLEEYNLPDCYRYGIQLLSTGKLIGMIDVVDLIEGAPVIGYVLGKDYWNKGYMSEAFSSVIGQLFKDRYSKILIEADERNIGSNRVIQKNGFEFVKKESKIHSSLKPELVTVNWYQKNK